jgi:hypothetical protein
MIFHNLTQCTGERCCWLKSTDVEQSATNFRRLLWSVPDEWLHLWHIGEEVILYDESIKAHNKIERIFAPVLIDLLNCLYFNETPKNTKLKSTYEIAMNCLKNDNLLFQKFNYWRGKIDKIKLKVVTNQVKKENNRINEVNHE